MKSKTARAATSALAWAAVTLAVAPATFAHPGVPSTVFDRDAVGWASVRDASSEGFASEFAKWSSAGQMVIDLEVDVTGGDYRVGAVFQQNTDGRAWRSLRNMSETEYMTERRRATLDGLRQVDFETYVLGGVRNYAAVWVENKEHLGSSARHDLTSEEFTAYFNDQRALGRMPLDVEQYATPAGWRFAAVWVDNAEHLRWELYRGLTSSEFAAAFADNAAAYRMLAIDSVATSAGQRYAGIWIENVNQRGWRELRDLTATEYANAWASYAAQGFRLFPMTATRPPRAPITRGSGARTTRRALTGRFRRPTTPSDPVTTTW